MSKQPKPTSLYMPSHAVILCHPDSNSFNASVAQTYCDAVRALRREVVLRDLYRIDFDPVLKSSERPRDRGYVASRDVVAEMDAIRDADVFVLVYPIWFGTPPAMMKGYVERVFGADFGYRAIQARDPHFMAGKHLVSITSSGTSFPWLNEQGAWESLRNVFDRYLANAFSMASCEHLHISNVVDDMGERSVREELFRVTEFARQTCARLGHGVPTGLALGA